MDVGKALETQENKANHPEDYYESKVDGYHSGLLFQVVIFKVSVEVIEMFLLNIATHRFHVVQ